MTAKPSPIEIAKSIKEAASRYGFRLDVRGGILTVTKRFTPCDNHAYVCTEGDAYSIVGMLKQTEPGSTWGSTSDGIGGHVALQSGNFILNKSGGSKRVLTALAKLGA